MRIGLVCPYTWDIPGGVQYHVRDLAQTLLALGHDVAVLTPANDEDELPPYVTCAGRAVPIRYNGSVARLQFGPVAAARVRRWLRDGHFDILHVHEPSAPSLSLLTCVLAKGPIVATFHAATVRSRWLAAVQGVLQPFMERISGRIAVSDLARRVQVEHLGGDAIVIPNGVDVARFASAAPLPGYPRAGMTIGFLGRFDEPRKGLPVLLDALAQIAPEHPDLRLLVAGRGDESDFLDELPDVLADRVTLLGEISEGDKARLLASIDIYCAPNLGGESFGVILVEAMAAGAAIVASDLDAFRRVLNDGAAGILVRRGSPTALAAAISQLLGDAGRRKELVQAGWLAVQDYDWPVVSERVLAVYETVVSSVGGEVEVSADQL
ncbi:MAG: glycosyltransferase family 4 protein [Geodermatophilaceae bacterium]|jgi:phosphatidylinositol alpha-mannosyltransferase|nr:glycosyltransferase family 4 protein [Geodermatophilaceae bacterium]